MDRKQIIQNLKNKRYTYQQIGNLLGITRQRAHQILTKEIPQTEIPKNWKPNNSYLKIPIISSIQGRDRLKEKVRIRDNHTCQICEKIWKEGQRRFDVHHLDENLEGVKGYSYENCKNLDRQITLCHQCHLRLNTIRKKFRKEDEDKRG